jgi:hypothetical protein
MFDYLPFYNKFRVPTLALFIPQLLFPVGAVLAINKLIQSDKKEALKKFKQASIAMLAIFVIAGLAYLISDFSNENKQRSLQFNQIIAQQDRNNLQAQMMELNQTYQPKADNQLYENLVFNYGENVAREILNAFKKDRQSLYGASIFRSLVFILFAAGLMFLFIRNKIKIQLLSAGLSLLVLFDLLSFGSNYLNKNNFALKETFEADEFPVTPADQAILQDKDPNYRVLNLTTGDPYQESHTSYYHKSIGGYHAAKLGIYDDLITYQLSGKQNMAVLNMLNTKYIIARAQPDSANPQAAATSVAHLNPDALGNAWFVQGVKWAQTPVEEMKFLDNFNPKDTAVVDISFKNIVGNFSPADSASTIQQTAFDNDAISYESNSTAPHVAIFSEIFYKDWNAYIDGKKTDIFKADYVLRGLHIPAGKHIIDFKFEPTIYQTSKTISLIFNWVVIALLFLTAFVWYGRKKSVTK